MQGELPKKMPENLLLLCTIATDMIITHFIYYFRDCGRLKSLAVGNYRLSFGQGLVMSTDYLMGKTIYASSFNNRSDWNQEGILLRMNIIIFVGVAATVALTKRLSVFWHSIHTVNMDGVVTDGEITSIYKTGLHRSQQRSG